MMIIDWNKNIKIGFIGLMNYMNATKSHAEIKYSDFVTDARHLCGELKARHVSYVIALASMSWSDAESLACQVSDIDIIILAEESDAYNNNNANDDYVRTVNNKIIMRNSNFKYLSLITIYFDKLANFKPVDIAISRFHATS